MRGAVGRFRQLHPLQRVAVIVWVGVLLGVAGRIAFSPPGAGSVVPIYLNAAYRWVHSEDLYAPARPQDVYRNPPWVAAAFVPLTHLSMKAAALLWCAAGAAVFLAGLAVWVRHGLPRPLSPGESGAVFALAAPLVLASLNNGQLNLVITGFLMLGATAAARGCGPLAGLWLAVAAGLKLFPVAAGLLIAAAFPRRVLPWFVLALAAVAVLPFALADADYVAEMHVSFRDRLRGEDRSFADFGRAPRDLFQLLRVWFAPPRPEVYRAVQLGTAVTMSGLVVLAARRVRDPRYVSALGLHLGCVWMTVLGPASEAHTYTILGPTAAAVAVLAFADRARPGGTFTFGLAAAGFGLLLAPVLRDMFPNGARFQAMGPHPVGGLLILAAVLLDVVGRIGGRSGLAGPPVFASWRVPVRLPISNRPASGGRQPPE